MVAAGIFSSLLRQLRAGRGGGLSAPPGEQNPFGFVSVENYPPLTHGKKITQGGAGNGDDVSQTK